MDIKCYTGGASGTDMLFEELCDIEDIVVIAYSFEGHTTSSNNRKILSDKELAKVNSVVKKVGKLIHRNPPFGRPHIIKFLQRDIYQSLFSEVVFGVGIMDGKNHMPAGGTAWAIGTGILLDLPVFFYDQEKKVWYQYDKSWVKTVFPDNKYFKLKSFTGIGTRSINNEGKAAVHDIVRCFKETYLNMEAKRKRTSKNWKH